MVWIGGVTKRFRPSAARLGPTEFFACYVSQRRLCILTSLPVGVNGKDLKVAPRSCFGYVRNVIAI
jgi:hypothetical protein